jgi:hypothetical protein
MIRRAGQRGVIQRPVFLPDQDGLAAHLDHQRFGHRLQLVRRRHAEADPLQPVDVIRPSGERHHRMQGQRKRPAGDGRLQHPDAVPAAGVHQQPARQFRAGGRQPRDQAGESIVGHGQQDQLRARRDLLRIAERDAGQAAVSTADRSLRDAGCGYHRVPRPGQHGAERRPHPAGPYDADPEPDGIPLSLRRGLARVHFRIHLVPVLTRYRTTALSISNALAGTVGRDLRQQAAESRNGSQPTRSRSRSSSGSSGTRQDRSR